jgi:CheY-specific phosphatase CheX
MSLREQILQALQESIVESVSIILSDMPKIAEKANFDFSVADNVAVSISFAGKLEGSVFLILSDEMVRKIIAKMLGCATSDVSEDCFDGVGEIVNIITGGVKTKLEPLGYDFVLSIPSVIKCDCNLSISSLGKAEKVCVSVTTKEFNFDIIMFYLVNSVSTKTAYEVMKDQKAQDAENKLRKMLDK